MEKEHPGLPQQFSQPPLVTYTLFYRHGNNPTCVKNFLFRGDIASAMYRGRKHCDLMGYTYIYIKPFISNLQVDEDRKSKGSESGQTSSGRLT